jgi:TFIIF-interacting CTD phosphatase-like protein
MLKSIQEQESVQKRQEAELMRLFKRNTNMSVVDDAEAVAESGIHSEEDE